MEFAVKLLITNLVIAGCAVLGRRHPSLAGLIASMPLTTLAVLLWLKADRSTDSHTLTAYVRGVLWGVIPTAVFFAAALISLKRGMPLGTALAISSASWLCAAMVHQLLVR